MKVVDPIESADLLSKNGWELKSGIELPTLDA